MAAAEDIGFLTIAGLPPEIPHGAEVRRNLLRIFALPPSEIRKLWRQKFDPSRPNVYRGWFPLQDGHATYKEGIDMGPDVAYGPSAIEPGDILREETPLPPEDALPGWREAVRTYYRAMEQVSTRLMRSLARGLGLPESVFDAAFAGGISTLRLIHYPPRQESSFAGAPAEEVWVMHEGERRHVTGRAHVDTGFVTLLAQDGVDGLQARRRSGEWIDVPPAEGTLAVNFGNSFERWTGGRIKATPHRVLGSGQPALLRPLLLRASGRCGDRAAALGRHRILSSLSSMVITSGRRPRASSNSRGWRICAGPGATPPPWARRSTTNAGRPRYPRE